MAGEAPVLEMAFDNVGLANFQPNTIAALDTSTNTTNSVVAAKIASTTGDIPLGVVYDAAKTDINGNIVSTGMNVRMMGIARVSVGTAVSPGLRVGPSTTAGVGAAIPATTTGSTVVGMCLNSCAAGDEALVFLTVGGKS